MSYDHVVIRGVPYYRSDTTIYTYDTRREPIAIGDYDRESDNVVLYHDWKKRVEQSLAEWRSTLSAHERDKLRENIIKPQKQRKAPRNPRKTTRAKAVKN